MPCYAHMFVACVYMYCFAVHTVSMSLKFKSETGPRDGTRVWYENLTKVWCSTCIHVSTWLMNIVNGSFDLSLIHFFRLTCIFFFLSCAYLPYCTCVLVLWTLHVCRWLFDLLLSSFLLLIPFLHFCFLATPVFYPSLSCLPISRSLSAILWTAILSRILFSAWSWARHSPYLWSHRLVCSKCHSC